MFNLKSITLVTFSVVTLTCSAAFADTTMSKEGQYIFNSLAFYIGGVLVAFMAAGFCMLESGLVTNKSVSSIAAKNIGKFAICSLVFFLVGYNLAYGISEGGYIGSFSIWGDASNMDVGYSVCIKKLGTIGVTVAIMRKGTKLPHEISIYSEEQLRMNAEEAAEEQEDEEGSE